MSSGKVSLFSLSLSICLSVCLYVCLSLPFYLSHPSSVFPLPAYLPLLSLSLSLSLLCLFLCLYVCLSVTLYLLLLLPLLPSSSSSSLYFNGQATRPELARVQLLNRSVGKLPAHPLRALGAHGAGRSQCPPARQDMPCKVFTCVCCLVAMDRMSHAGRALQHPHCVAQI